MKKLTRISGKWVNEKTGETFNGVVPRDLDIGDQYAQTTPIMGTHTFEVVEITVSDGYPQIFARSVTSNG